MISLNEALASYARSLRALPTIQVPICAALNHVLASDVHAATDLPRFAQSAMDGYAFAAASVAAASAEQPITLPIAQHLPATAYGQPPRLAPGSAARILTGAPVPIGADTVIPQERIERIEQNLRFTSAYSAKRNIRWQAEELKKGELIAEHGQRLTPGLLASLINADLEHLTVYRQPRIRVFVSGDELRAVGEPLKFGEIHDSNGPLVEAVLTRWGYPMTSIERLPDNAPAIRTALSLALSDADLIITCGGASVGDKDYLPATARELGAEQIFWQVAQKPGKPIWFGIHHATERPTAILALPGNPGAVLIGMLLHVRTVLNHLENQRHPAPHWASGRLTTSIDCDSRRERLVRMQLHHDAHGTAQLTPLKNQDSHMLGNLAEADVVVRIPVNNQDLPTGTIAQWIRLD